MKSKSWTAFSVFSTQATRDKKNCFTFSANLQHNNNNNKKPTNPPPQKKKLIICLNFLFLQVLYLINFQEANTTYVSMIFLKTIDDTFKSQLCILFCGYKAYSVLSTFVEIVRKTGYLFYIKSIKHTKISELTTLS